MTTQTLQQPLRYLDTDSVCRRYGISRSLLLRLVTDRKFPEPRKFGKLNRWSIQVLDQHDSESDSGSTLLQKQEAHSGSGTELGTGSNTVPKTDPESVSETDTVTGPETQCCFASEHPTDTPPVRTTRSEEDPESKSVAVTESEQGSEAVAEFEAVPVQEAVPTSFSEPEPTQNQHRNPDLLTKDQ